MALVEAGDVPGVLRALGELGTEQRAAQLPELDARYEELGFPGWLELTVEQRVALAGARLGCQPTSEAAARHLHHGGRYVPPNDAWMVDVVELFPVAWRTELVARLDEQVRERSGSQRLHLVVDHIVRTTGCPMPESDYFLSGWLSSHHRATSEGVLERLREDPLAPKLLPLVLERSSLPFTPQLLSALCAFAAEGTVDRAALVRRTFAIVADAHPTAALPYWQAVPLTGDEHARTAPERTALAEKLLTRLLGDGAPKTVTPVMTFLRALALTPAEQAPFLRDHVALLDLSSPVASYGQEVLRELDEAGLLEEDVLSEACERVLLRPEKKLVRAQLSWLDRVARREPARAGRISVCAALAFGHPDVSVQERALNLVARHLKNAGDPVRAQLRTAAAASLGPALAARAAQLLGAEAPGAEHDTGTGTDTGTERVTEAEVLPHLPGLRPVPGPVGTAVEVAQELAVVLADDDVVAFERALDGLVRQARLDRAALSRALEPVMRRAPGVHRDCGQSDLYDVAAAVRGDEPRRLYGRPHRRISHGEAISPPGKLLMARLVEALDVIESGAQPFLLALPTHVTGAVDAGVLVERVAELERARVEPAPVDLAQALLRVTLTSDESVLRAAGGLRSEAGRRLARWLREGGLPHQDSTPEKWPVADPTDAPPGLWDPVSRRPDQGVPLPPVAAAVCGTYERGRSPGGGYSLYDAYAAPYWVAQLPHHRDEVAAYAKSCVDGRMLALLAEAGGPAGYALHWQIACRLGEDRDSAVDALLVLAAQGQLDGRLLAGQLQALIRNRSSSPKRVVDALRAAAGTGAYATVWSVLEAALPALLRGTPVREAGAFLALAVECASRCAAKGPIPEVEVVAARTGSSQTVKHARLLRDVLR
ncbi:MULTISPECIES: DUF7824 domain-containing protein [Streptomyces]|uniref:DUF7824 domain-containing protein n=1 Tax=Streptomyces TaxID=1883 RepID=UPI000FB45818|nr:DUF6493 family protein [Streptomyces sp. WAC05458]RSS25341.1 hypothetical protein EF914_05480 [Streptomyces sp. WAC05458]